MRLAVERGRTDNGRFEAGTSQTSLPHSPSVKRDQRSLFTLQIPTPTATENRVRDSSSPKKQPPVTWGAWSSAAQWFRRESPNRRDLSPNHGDVGSLLILSSVIALNTTAAMTAAVRIIRVGSQQPN